MDISAWIYDAFMNYFEKKGLKEMRKRVLEGVRGRVLELGPGTGVNLKFYSKEHIQSLTFVDLNFKSSLEEKARKKCPNITLIKGDAQHLPFEDKTFDSVVFTLVMCSVDDPFIGLGEVRRVLKDDGSIHFIEHVEPEKGRLKSLFNSINPAWHSFSGGCNLNRDTEKTLEDAGFKLKIMDKKFSNIFIAGTGVKNI